MARQGDELVVERVEQVRAVRDQVGADPREGVGRERHPGHADGPRGREERVLAVAGVVVDQGADREGHEGVVEGRAVGAEDDHPDERVQVRERGGGEHDPERAGVELRLEQRRGEQRPEGEVDQRGGHGRREGTARLSRFGHRRPGRYP